MGQNTYAEWFINTMLGWIRWIAGGIATMFQSNNSRGSSSGSQIISWFSDNWISLLIALVAFGVVMDWVVWMIRWRPYWLWFRKKRVLLDDDIDAILNDEELMRKFAPPPKERPHFRASQLGRGGRPIPKDELTETLYDPLELDPDYDEEFDVPDIEDPYDGVDPDAYNPRIRVRYDDDDDEYGDFEPAEPDAEESYEDYEDEEPFDRLYNETYHAVPQTYEDDDEGDFDEDDPDISFLEADGDEDDDGDDERPRRRSQRSGFFAKLRKGKRNREEDDPFSVDDADFYDPDDEADFLQRLQQAPPAQADDDDGFGALYPEQKSEISDELSPEDWRTGYSVYNSTVEPPAASRRARRQLRERNKHDDQ